MSPVRLCICYDIGRTTYSFLFLIYIPNIKGCSDFGAKYVCVNSPLKPPSEICRVVKGVRFAINYEKYFSVNCLRFAEALVFYNKYSNE